MNKKITLLLLILCAAIRGFAQCVPLSFNSSNPDHINTASIMLLNIKTDFCASGDGTTNDQAAFDSATAFINKRGGYCKLVVPAGTYRIGRQFKTASRYLSTAFGMQIKYVNKLEIEGVGNPVIKYMDNLKYGYFDTITGLPKDIDGIWSYADAAKISADLGHMLYFENSQNIKVSNLVLDGNVYSGTMQIGGRNVDNFLGIQELFSGICIWITDSVEISNVVSRRMGLDGFLIWEGSNRSITIQDCQADYNGRQGLSIVNGEHITVNNSSFTNSGMGELIYTGLQGGVDIEPEAAVNRIKDVHFNNCTFADCRNAAVIVNSGVGKASDIYFNDCMIQNANEIGNSVALDIGRHKNVRFNDCKLYGYVTINRADSAMNANEGYLFKRCLFSDCFHKRIVWNVPGPFPAQACALVRENMALTSTVLIYNYGNAALRYINMDSCTFDTYTKRPWGAIRNDPAITSAITNSVVYVNGQTGTDIPNSVMFNTILQDEGFDLANNKFYMHPDQAYLHGVDTISGSTPASGTTTWNGNTFYRWSGSMPANICADSLPCTLPFQANGQVMKGDTYSEADLSVTIHPNPSDGLFTVRFGKNVSNAFIVVRSVAGDVMLQQVVSGWAADVDLNKAPAGIYFVVVSDATQIKSQKMIKR
jgi:hypothetical protein